MKLFLLLLTLLTTRYLAYPVVKTWTFHELAKATARDTSVFRYREPDKFLVKAFDQMMTAVFKGKPNYVQSILLSPSGDANWTKSQLETALRNVHTYIYFTPFIGQAYVQLNDFNEDSSHKKKMDSIEVEIDALDISTWTKQDIYKALNDQSINPDLLPFLKEAKTEIKEKEAGIKKLGRRWWRQMKRKGLNITIVTPVGLIPPPPGVLPIIVPRPNHDFKTYENNKQDKNLN